MLRTALALLSTLQLGSRIKESVERSLRQAGIFAVAAVLLLAGLVFGLVAAYHALVSIYLFSPAAAAAIMAVALVAVGLIVIGIASSIGKEPKKRPAAPSAFSATGEGPAGLIDQGVGKAMQQVGPLPLLAAAFFAGLYAGRR